jgi:hypothetical protein
MLKGEIDCSITERRNRTTADRHDWAARNGTYGARERGRVDGMYLPGTTRSSRIEGQTGLRLRG